MKCINNDAIITVTVCRRYRDVDALTRLVLMVEVAVGLSMSITAVEKSARLSYAGSVIDSIQLTYKLSNGHYTTGKCFGGRGGKQHVINIDVNRGEKIIGVFGRNGRLVDQLGFVTNKGRIFGPYGSCGGGKFTVNSCEVRGIFGRSGSLIDSIGFFCGTVQ